MILWKLWWPFLHLGHIFSIRTDASGSFNQMEFEERKETKKWISHSQFECTIWIHCTASYVLNFCHRVIPSMLGLSSKCGMHTISMCCCESVVLLQFIQIDKCLLGRAVHQTCIVTIALIPGWVHVLTRIWTSQWTNERKNRASVHMHVENVINVDEQINGTVCFSLRNAKRASSQIGCQNWSEYEPSSGIAIQDWTKKCHSWREEIIQFVNIWAHFIASIRAGSAVLFVYLLAYYYRRVCMRMRAYTWYGHVYRTKRQYIRVLGGLEWFPYFLDTKISFDTVSSCWSDHSSWESCKRPVAPHISLWTILK